MSVFEYVDIPPYATPLTSEQNSNGPISRAAAHKVSVPLPNTEHSETPNTPSAARPQSPSSVKPTFNITSFLVSSGLHVPSPSAASPRQAPYLLSTRNPLSLPTTTSNFRQFVAKSGPIFWIQDRIEEVILWRKGWSYTASWMLGYTFLCCYPRLILFLPNVIIITIILKAYSWRQNAQANKGETEDVPIVTTPVEGSKEWFSNMQAIQNLMGFIADIYDAVISLLPLVTFSTPYTYTLFAFLTVLTIAMIPIVYFIPLQPVLIFGGLLPLALTHPRSLSYLSSRLGPLRKRIRMHVQRFVDDDQLEDWHWAQPKKEVELWENERYIPSTGWSKQNLRADECKGWVKGTDGWSDAAPVSTGDAGNLTLSLSPGWSFVETEDWRKDLGVTWSDVSSDADGWIYFDDSWQDPQSAPLEEWTHKGLTRRRRWTRRIFYESNTNGS